MCGRVEFLSLIFAVSKFGDFKRQSYWRYLILAVSQFNVLNKLLSILIGDTFKGKNSPFKNVISSTLKQTLPFKNLFQLEMMFMKHYAPNPLFVKKGS